MQEMQLGSTAKSCTTRLPTVEVDEWPRKGARVARQQNRFNHGWTRINTDSVCHEKAQKTQKSSTANLRLLALISED
jgi:hypothetical protein